MQIAIDSNGHRVHISQTKDKEDYFCTICGEKFVLKKGEERRHHFAHRPCTHCVDTWHYDDMSKWHLDWQNKFDEKYQEVVKSKDGIKHRADILIEERKIVVEFQHSNLSSDEFEARNSFYNSLGYKVIWLFDLIEKKDDGKIKDTSNDKYFRWVNHPHTFDKYDCKNNNVEVYFQFYCDSEEDEYLQNIIRELNNPEMEDCIDKIYYRSHYGRESWIVKLSWISDSGIECFAIKDDYNTKEFVDFLMTGQKYIETNNCGKTLFELWQDDFLVAIFRNVKTNRKVKVGRTVNGKRTEKSKWYGYLSKNEREYYDDRREIFHANNKEWICEWSKRI